MAKKGPVRVFLDSNVVLSGLLSGVGAPRIILDLFCLRLPFLVGMTGEYNIIEIERNLKKKLPAAIPVYREYLPKLHLEIIPMPPAEEVKKSLWDVSDKDIPVLVSAIKGKADYLVTGDKKDFTNLKTKGNNPFKILSPSEFVDIILPELLKEITE